MRPYPLLDTINSPHDVKRLLPEQLPDLAQEMREAICEQVSKSGGHLAPNLGVVELTIALHYVFDFGFDRLLFDVGHQCYPHKLLTGRFPQLESLRTTGGIAGFPEPRESAYDQFAVGHAGTGISTAIGMARGDQLNGELDRKVVALVGDSSIVNGLSLEGLTPQGALAGYFDKVRIHPRFTDLKSRALDVLKRLPAGSTLEQIYNRAGEVTKAALDHTHLFDHFGLLCIGPVDGHDLPTLVEMLEDVKKIDTPVLLHTRRSRSGYTAAAQS